MTKAATPYSPEAMRARLDAATKERAKLAPKLESLQGELAKHTNAARKVRDQVVAAKEPIAALDNEIASISRALGATSISLEAGKIETKLK